MISFPDLKERFSQTDIEVVGGSPSVFDRRIRAQDATCGKVVKEANIRADST